VLRCISLHNIKVIDTSGSCLWLPHTQKATLYSQAALITSAGNGAEIVYTQPSARKEKQNVFILSPHLVF
jgi:hypothetical protein